MMLPIKLEFKMEKTPNGYTIHISVSTTISW